MALLGLLLRILGGGNNKKRKEKKRSPHPVIPCPSAGAKHNGELRNVGTGDGGDKLGAVFGYASFFGIGADHETANVLKKHKRDVTLRTQLDEMCAFEGGLGE